MMKYQLLPTLRAMLNSDYKITEDNLPESSIPIKAKNLLNVTVLVAIIANSKNKKS